MKFLLLLALLAGTAQADANVSQEDPELARARELFQRYVALEQSFDTKLIELYASDATIHAVKKFPNGKMQDFPIPIGQYKGLLREAMRVAREEGHKQVYSQVRYTREERGVRVDAVRFSFPKESRSRVSFLFGPAGDGEWRILEESTLSDAKRANATRAEP